MELLKELCQLNEELKLIKGVVCFDAPDVDAGVFKRVWAFRTWQDARDHARSIFQAMTNDDKAIYSVASATCQVEMAGLLVPSVVAVTKRPISAGALNYIGVGKTKAEILEDAEEYIDKNQMNQNDIDWLGFVTLDEDLEW